MLPLASTVSEWIQRKSRAPGCISGCYNLRDMRLRAFFISTLILAGLAQSSSESAVILGVVEDLPGNYAEAPRHRSVRVAFKKAGDDWQPYPSDCPNQACLTQAVAE